MSTTDKRVVPISWLGTRPATAGRVVRGRPAT